MNLHSERRVLRFEWGKELNRGSLNKNTKKHDKYERIIEAAIKVFSQKGFHKSRISDIAEEAKVADGTIYLYFKNKDDLLITIFESKLKEIIDVFSKAIKEEPDPIFKLARFICLYFSMMEQHPDLASILTVELRQSHKFMKEYTPQKFGEFLKLITDIVIEGKDKNLFREDVLPGVVKRGLFGAMNEMETFWMLVPKAKRSKYSSEDAARQMCDIFIRGLLKDPKLWDSKKGEFFKQKGGEL